MATFVKTLSFSTSAKFDSEKDDQELNSALAYLQERGAKVIDIRMMLAGQERSTSATYMIIYEASAAL